DSVTRPATSLPKSRVSDEFRPEIRVGRPDRTFCGLATDPEVPCTAVGATVRDVGERFSASIAPGGAARAASAAGSIRGPVWAEADGTGEALARPTTSRTLDRMTVRRDGPRIRYLPMSCSRGVWLRAGPHRSGKATGPEPSRRSAGVQRGAVMSPVRWPPLRRVCGWRHRT